MSQALQVTGREAMQGQRTRHWPRRGAIAVLVVLVALSVVFIVPFAWLIITALKATSELSAFPIRWFPQHAQWGNFRLALTMIDYGKYTRNSFVLATIFAVLTTVTSALVGFGFARLKAPGLRPLFIVMLATTLPVLVLFFVAQRYFVQGIVTTGLKG